MLYLGLNAFPHYIKLLSILVAHLFLVPNVPIVKYCSHFFWFACELDRFWTHTTLSVENLTSQIKLTNLTFNVAHVIRVTKYYFNLIHIQY